MMGNGRRAWAMALSLLLISAVALFPAHAKAMLVEEKDQVPAVGRSSKQLFWRTHKVTFAELKGSRKKIVEYLEKPEQDAFSFGGTSRRERWKYMGEENGYYAFFCSFSGVIMPRIGYVAPKDARLVKRSKKYLIRRAGTYQCTGKNTETTLSSYDCYYVQALKGQTGSVRISDDADGKNIVAQATFEDGYVFYAANGKYVTFENAELMSPDIAPSAVIERHAAELLLANTRVDKDGTVSIIMF